MADHRVWIRSGRGALRTLSVHPATAKLHGFVDRAGKKVELQCAARRTTVSVQVDERVGQGSWSLSSTALSDLELGSRAVQRVHFRLKWGGGQGIVRHLSGPPRLTIGPVIGVMAGARRQQLMQNRHGFPLLDLVWNVEQMGGLVYFFAAEDIDWERRSIVGFVHLPDKVKWDEGRFPFPGAIYRRGAVPAALFRRIAREVTPNVFNVYAGNKLKQVKILQRDARLAGCLPETHALDSEATLGSILDRYGAAYVKNTSIGAAKGVFRIERFRGGFSARARKGSMDVEEVNAWAGGFSALLDYVTEKVGRPLSSGHWIVQQPISLARLEGRRVDFRMTVQKDGSGRWTIRGAYARVAPSEEAVITRRGTYREAGVALRTLWPRRAGQIRNEMARIARAACERLEQGFGLLGDVGVDLGLDPWGNIWFLEANPGPGYRPLDRSNRSDAEYWRQVEGPILFASYLCGFDSPSWERGHR